jgi:STE24 endopeptidase
LARLQLLLPLVFWALWISHGDLGVVHPAMGTPIYFLSLALIVVTMRRWARGAMHGTTFRSTRATVRFHQGMFAARWCVMAVHVVSLFYLGWGELILWTGLAFDGRVESLPAMVSMIPVVLAWIGLIWAQYPLDRAIREQNLMAALNAGDAFFQPPELGPYLASNTRLQVFSLLAPVAIAILLRDLVMLLMSRSQRFDLAEMDIIATLVGAGFVFLIGPEILRRVLPVTRLPDSPLRERLEAMCDRLGLRYRDILIWRTHFSFGNAAVMGLVPRFRYIMLSDLLIETMNERQIEAVFAHEVGHVKHWHMTWYVIFAVVFFAWLDASEQVLSWAIWNNNVPASMPLDAIIFGLGIIGFFIVFGSLSRSFERQADLFAARSVVGGQAASAVQPAGVEVFNSALAHVARINNMPLDATSYSIGRGRWGRVYGWLVHHSGTWLHGSIRSRMEYLRSLPDAPEATARFDRRMYAIRVGLLVALCSTTAWVVTSMMAG